MGQTRNTKGKAAALGKIVRLKELRREVAEQDYQSALMDVRIAENLRDAANHELDARQNHAVIERKANLARIFTGSHTDTAVNAHIAVAAHLRNREDIATAHGQLERARTGVVLAQTVADTKRIIFAGAQRGERKIKLMCDRMEHTALRQQ